MTGRVPPLVIAPSLPGSAGFLMATSSAKEVARAWEDFAGGENIETGVRPEILASWYRCRDRYDVDRALDVAPEARGDEGRMERHRRDLHRARRPRCAGRAAGGA